MKKMVGYILALGGLALMAIGFGAFGIKSEVLGSFGSNTLSIAGVVLTVFGIFISLKAEGDDDKQAEEVPIYEGKGKHRHIVGYQRGN